MSAVTRKTGIRPVVPWPFQTQEEERMPRLGRQKKWEPGGHVRKSNSAEDVKTVTLRYMLYFREMRPCCKTGQREKGAVRFHNTENRPSRLPRQPGILSLRSGILIKNPVSKGLTVYNIVSNEHSKPRNNMIYNQHDVWGLAIVACTPGACLQSRDRWPILFHYR
jgi:hypothetical protein